MYVKNTQFNVQASVSGLCMVEFWVVQYLPLGKGVSENSMCRYILYANLCLVSLIKGEKSYFLYIQTNWFAYNQH